MKNRGIQIQNKTVISAGQVKTTVMDYKYWENYYNKQNTELVPSLFAQYVADILGGRQAEIIELGCGNGRDSVFFANKGHLVDAVDQCYSEICFLMKQYQSLDNLDFRCDDFTDMTDDLPYDMVYSRFTLHSISKEQQTNTLQWAFRNLKKGGRLCIEVRGQRNEIYKLGEPVENEENAFIYNNHYRRFLKFEDLCEELKNIGFKLDFAAEDKDFAPFNGQNETYIRVIAEK